MEVKIMDDIRTVCKECGKEFLITTGEQKFYAEKQFPLPKRCPICRKIRKKEG